MTSPRIRPATAADHQGVADVHAVCFPHQLLSAASLAHTLKTSAGDSPSLYVAEVDGRVVGSALTSFARWSSTVNAVGTQLGVLPAFRRRGLGSALLAKVEEHHAAIGGSTLSSHTGGDDGVDFAVKRGFAAGRTGRISRALLDRMPAATEVPAGVEIRRLSEVDDWRALYETDVAAIADIPGSVPLVAPAFDRWREEILADPRMDTASSVIAVEGETVVALAYLYRNGDRVYSNFTGTHPAHRGRGLAMLVKSHSLHAARRAGVREAYTVNDAENAAMLAVNTRLGYEVFQEQRAVKRGVAAAG